MKITSHHFPTLKCPHFFSLYLVTWPTEPQGIWRPHTIRTYLLPPPPFWSPQALLCSGIHKAFFNSSTCTGKDISKDLHVSGSNDAGLSSYLVFSERPGWALPTTLPSFIRCLHNISSSNPPVYSWVCLFITCLHHSPSHHEFLDGRAWLVFNIRGFPESRRTIPVVF